MSDLTIALDVMGGDFGPSVTLKAAATALLQNPSLSLLLVGKSNQINPWLKSLPTALSSRAKLVHAEHVIAMDEKLMVAIRKKPKSSMRLALDEVAAGRAQACVSAGNTGALMALSKIVIKTLPGIERPALVASLPTVSGGKVRILDLGANIDCSAKVLFQFSIMGSALVQIVDQKPNPKVALLNVGEEEIKGNEKIKQTAQMLQKCASVNYCGFVEGNSIFIDQTDVVVCDGFVGNVCLKTCEGVAQLFLAQLFGKQSSWKRWLAKKLFPDILKFKAAISPEKYNGASLLGLQGVVVKSHGNADVTAFNMAIIQAITEVEKQVPQQILTLLQTA